MGVKLDVGGRIFTTSRCTLLTWEGTYFHAMLSSGKWEPDEDGAYFIDRDPTLFDRVIDCLRTGLPVDVEDLSARQLKRLQAEMDYYQLPKGLMPHGSPPLGSTFTLFRDGGPSTPNGKQKGGNDKKTSDSQSVACCWRIGSKKRVFYWLKGIVPFCRTSKASAHETLV